MRDAAVIDVARSRLRTSGAGAEETLLLAGVTQEQLDRARSTHAFTTSGRYVHALQGYGSDLELNAFLTDQMIEREHQLQRVAVMREYEAAYQAQAAEMANQATLLWNSKRTGRGWMNMPSSSKRDLGEPAEYPVGPFRR